MIPWHSTVPHKASKLILQTFILAAESRGNRITIRDGGCQAFNQITPWILLTPQMADEYCWRDDRTVQQLYF